MTIAQTKRRRKQMAVDPRYKNVLKSLIGKKAFQDKKKKR